MGVSVKSDIKRSDRKKTNKEKLNKEKTNKEKMNRERSGIEKSDIEKSDIEKSDPDAKKTDVNEKDAVRNDTVRKDTEKKDAEVPDRESPDLKGSDVGAHDAGDGEPPTAEKGLKTADGAEKAGSTEEAGIQEKKSEKDSAVKARTEEFDDLEEEGEDWENDDSQDDWEEESEPSKPWVMALVLLGMIVAAACICVMLWSFTHTGGQEEDQNVFGATVTPGNGDITAPNASGTGNGTLENQGGNTTSGPNSGESGTPAPDLNRVTTQDGRVIIFTECDDMVTPKEYVNLRTEPSTNQGEATVSCRLNNGEVAHRTGISEEMGWSRVEYNDQVLYVVSSFVNVVTDGQTAE